MSGLDELAVVFGGRRYAGMWDQICRYAGLPWSRGGPEVWAFAYYDQGEFGSPHDVQVDVPGAASLHPGLSRSDLAFFVTENDSLTEWLKPIPVGVPLQQLDRQVVDHIGSLPQFDTVGLGLLSKVLHRKRPDAIPLLDRHVIDLYRPITGERTAAAAYPGIVHAMRDDLEAGAALALAMMQLELEKRTGVTASMLRLADIGIWMDAHHPASDNLAEGQIRL